MPIQPIVCVFFAIESTPFAACTGSATAATVAAEYPDDRRGFRGWQYHSVEGCRNALEKRHAERDNASALSRGIDQSCRRASRSSAASPNSSCRRARATRTATCSARRTKFPYAPNRRYTPEDAPKEALAALHAYLGVERKVIVQASCHGTDNRAMLHAIAADPARHRGVAIRASTDLHSVHLIELVRRHNGWVTGSERISFPPYDQAIPIARALIEAGEARVLWGTDFPHPNATREADEAELVDLIPQFAPTAAEQQRLPSTIRRGCMVFRRSRIHFVTSPASQTAGRPAGRAAGSR
jgi:Amidohydrolase